MLPRSSVTPRPPRRLPELLDIDITAMLVMREHLQLGGASDASGRVGGGGPSLRGSGDFSMMNSSSMRATRRRKVGGDMSGSVTFGTAMDAAPSASSSLSGDRTTLAPIVQFGLWQVTLQRLLSEHKSIAVASEVILYRVLEVCKSERQPNLLSTGVALMVMHLLASAIDTIPANLRAGSFESFTPGRSAALLPAAPTEYQRYLRGIADELAYSIYVTPDRWSGALGEDAAQCFGRATLFDSFFSLQEMFTFHHRKAANFVITQVRSKVVMDRAVGVWQVNHCRHLFKRWRALVVRYRNLRLKYKKLFAKVSTNRLVLEAVNGWRTQAHRTLLKVWDRTSTKQVEQLHVAHMRHKQVEDQLTSLQSEGVRLDRHLQDAQNQIDRLRGKLVMIRSTIGVEHTKYVALRRRWADCVTLMFNDTNPLPGSTGAANSSPETTNGGGGVGRSSRHAITSKRAARQRQPVLAASLSTALEQPFAPSSPTFEETAGGPPLGGSRGVVVSIKEWMDSVLAASPQGERSAADAPHRTDQPASRRKSSLRFASSNNKRKKSTRDGVESDEGGEDEDVEGDHGSGIIASNNGSTASLTRGAHKLIAVNASKLLRLVHALLLQGTIFGQEPVDVQQLVLAEAADHHLHHGGGTGVMSVEYAAAHSSHGASSSSNSSVNAQRQHLRQAVARLSAAGGVDPSGGVGGQTNAVAFVPHVVKLEAAAVMENYEALVRTVAPVSVADVAVADPLCTRLLVAQLMEVHVGGHCCAYFSHCIGELGSLETPFLSRLRDDLRVGATDPTPETQNMSADWAYGMHRCVAVPAVADAVNTAIADRLLLAEVQAYQAEVNQLFDTLCMLPTEFTGSQLVAVSKAAFPFAASNSPLHRPPHLSETDPLPHVTLTNFSQLWDTNSELYLSSVADLGVYFSDLAEQLGVHREVFVSRLHESIVATTDDAFLFAAQDPTVQFVLQTFEVELQDLFELYTRKDNASVLVPSSMSASSPSQMDPQAAGGMTKSSNPADTKTTFLFDVASLYRFSQHEAVRSAGVQLGSVEVASLHEKISAAHPNDQYRRFVLAVCVFAEYADASPFVPLNAKLRGFIRRLLSAVFH